MLTVFLIGFACLNIVVCLRRPRMGLALYLATSLLAPHLQFGQLTLAYEIVAFAPVALAVLIQERQRVLGIPHALVWGHLFLLAAVTLLQGYEPSWIGLLGNLRFAVILSLSVGVLGQELIARVALIVLAVNAGVALVQMMLPETVHMFYSLYFKDSATPLEAFLVLGRFLRATGTFSSPVHLGAIALIGFGLFLGRFLSGNRMWTTWLGLACSLTAALLSVTKTAILGVPIVLVVGLLLRAMLSQPRQRRSSTGMGAVFGLAAMGVVLAALLGAAGQAGFQIWEYLAILRSPLEAFTTRYGAAGGNLTETMEVVRAHPVFGVGRTVVDGEFVGDSAYVILLHDTGLVGAGVFAGLLVWAFATGVRRADIASLLMVAALLLVAFACSAFISLFSVLVIAYAGGGRGRKAASVAAAPLASRRERATRRLRKRPGFVPSWAAEAERAAHLSH